jgi:hypothetical protein
MPTYAPIDGTFWNSMGEISTMIQVAVYGFNLSFGSYNNLGGVQ